MSLVGTAFPGLVELREALRTRRTTSTEAVDAALARIRAVDPVVHAVLALDPTAPEQARRSDALREAGREPGQLDGIPVLVKDSIDTAGLASTSGSRLLTAAPPGRDAAVVTALRRAGAVLMGKTNLTEWGNFRSVHGIEGWSAVGGQTRNPHDSRHSPWGSSAGSAVAVAAGMVPVALGTETDGSIVCPAGQNGVVGVKPEHGFTSLDGVAPISSAQDSVGVLARSVADAAAVLAALGPVPGKLPPSSLRHRRFGLWRVQGMPAGVDAVLDEVSAAVRGAGAAVVPVDLGGHREILVDGLLALVAEFRPGVERYLRARGGCPATLDELITANRRDDVELGLFGQDLFERAAAVSPQERIAAGDARRRAGRAARALIGSVMREHDLDAVLAPANAPAWRIDHEHGDPRTVSSSTPAAVAGHANVAVPAGFVNGLPVGLSVFGPRTVARLLPLAAAVERVVDVRRQTAS